MTTLSKTLSRVKPSPTIAVSTMARELKEAGRRAAARFLSEEGEKVGRESSVDLAAIYGDGLGRTFGEP